MEQPSGIPRPSSGIPRPTSRLPVLRPAVSQGLRQSPSTEQLRKKPSLSSVSSRLSQQPSPLQKKPSLSSIARPNQQPPSLQKKPSLSSISRVSQQPSALQKKPSLSSVSRASQQQPPLQKKPSRTSLARSSIVPPAAQPSSNRTSVLTSKRSLSSLTPIRTTVADEPVFKKPIGRPPARQIRASSHAQGDTVHGPRNDDVLGDLDAFRSASRASSRASSRADFYGSPTEQVLGNDDGEMPPSGVRKSRPSLSERTIESLSQLPSSPAAGKTRRRPSFFNNGDSMGPPPRPASAMSNGRRPTTSDGTPRLAPTTPNQHAQDPQRGSMTVPGKRSVSAATYGAPATPSRLSSTARPLSTAKKPPLAQAQNRDSTLKQRPLPGSKTTAARTPKGRQSLTGNFGQAISPSADSQMEMPTLVPKAPETARKTANSSAALREQLAKAKAAKRTEILSGPTTSSKPTSSQALRAQIAKAREAAKRTNGSSPPRPRTNTPPRDAIIPDPAEIASFDFGLEEDPFNQRPKGGPSLLRKRVDAARAEGRLNIAAMGLSEVPEEVLNMYQYDPDANMAWGEVVDLTALIAADNELETLPESMFPDVDYETVMESDDNVPQFGGIVNLDLHGNLFQELPTGLGRLPQLSRLNLSRNKLSIDALDVIFRLSTLRDLKLAENSLAGAFPAGIENLNLLETLDLQGNEVTSLPQEVRALTHLRSLNVSNNKMTSVPSELFTSISVVELSASKNCFTGAFFQVDAVPHLQTLYLSGNSLTDLCTSGIVSLPSLKHLDVSVNRLSSLPSMTTWTNMVTLLVGENKLSSIPEGFSSLQQLKKADFTANSIDKLDDRIALMESLENLTLAANPLRERKFLTMNADDIKRDLMSRLDPKLLSGADLSEGHAVDEDAVAEGNGWTLTPSGTLDLSANDMADLDAEAMVTFAGSHDVKQLYLQQNSLKQIPIVISQLAFLSTLDLSKNDIVDPLAESLALPKLGELRLRNNRIKTLHGIMEMLSAPSLHHLDVSNNRISGPLPALREAFPRLTTLLASDNSIDDVSDTSLAGLKIVSLSNNDITRLEPRIGLLAGTLTSFDAEGNKFRVPNYAVLRKGTDAVLSWLKDRVPSPTEEYFDAESPTF